MGDHVNTEGAEDSELLQDDQVGQEAGRVAGPSRPGQDDRAARASQPDCLGQRSRRLGGHIDRQETGTPASNIRGCVALL